MNDTTPQYEDEDVRFRTTYYLRVFDLCRVDESTKKVGPKTNTTGAEDPVTNKPNANNTNKDDKKKSDQGATVTHGKNDQQDSPYAEGRAHFVHRTTNHYRIVKDSLYRIRMTGQAQAFYTKVRFESGTLRDYQIDPFGQIVKLDAQPSQGLTPGCPRSEHPETPSGSCPSPPANDSKDVCPDGDPLAQKFYLLGPENVRELDRDERLVMAMTTDATPLINALQRISGIKTQADADTSAQYQVKRDQARTAIASDLLEQAKEQLGKENSPLDETTSPTAITTSILNLFEIQRGTP